MRRESNQRPSKSSLDQRCGVGWVEPCVGWQPRQNGIRLRQRVTREGQLSLADVLPHGVVRWMRIAPGEGPLRSIESPTTGIDQAEQHIISHNGVGLRNERTVLHHQPCRAPAWYEVESSAVHTDVE